MTLDSVRALKASLAGKLARGKVGGRGGRSPAPLPAFALGITERRKHDFLLAVRVQRRWLEKSPELDAIRQTARGEVEVRYIGRVQKLTTLRLPSVSPYVRPPWRQRRCRPLRIGCSIGHAAISGGTLGGFARSLTQPGTLLLSSNHVLANENDASEGDEILQPARHDGGARAGDVVGALAAFVPLKPRGINVVDAAVASVKSSVEPDGLMVQGLGNLTGAGPDFVHVGELVYKLGRSTGLTRGRITAFEIDNVVVEYNAGDLRFDNQIEVEGADEEPFADEGDSGALVLDEIVQALGLLFASSDQGGRNGTGLTYANPIHAVLNALSVELM